MVYKLFSIICASSLPFLFSLQGDFVFDDAEAIVKNVAVKSESWSQPFYTDFWGTNIASNLSHKSYRPLTVLSFRLNYLFSGKELSATEFKVTNLICHVISCILLWLTLKTMLRRLKIHRNKKCIDIAWLSSLLFSVHPVHVEAVSGAVGRADLLAAVTFFTAFLFYNKAITKSYMQYLYLLATVLMASISMLFKENGITVLAVCVCFEAILMLKEDTRPSRKRELCKEKFLNILISTESIIRLTVVVMSIFMLLYARWIIMGGEVPSFKATENPAAFSDSKITKIGTFSYLYFLNALLLVWPQWLCFDWSMGCVPLIESIKDYRLLPVYIMYIFGAWLAIRIYRERNRLMLMALCLIIMPFMPAANIFYTVGFVIAERVLYIPSAGYCLLVVLGLNKLCHSKVIYRKCGYTAFFIVLCIFATKSYERSFAWMNEYDLFVSALSVCPLNAKVHYNIAKVADYRGQTELAMAEYREALRLYPEYYQAMNNLANLLKNQKEYQEAERYLRSAIKLKEDFPAAWMNLGILLAHDKKYDQAQRAYETALKYRHNYPDCIYNLGNLYLDKNETVDALENWLLAIKIKPNHKLAWVNVLGLLDHTGQYEKALKMIPLVLFALPEVPEVHFSIANIYGKMGRYDTAEEHFRKAIQLFGGKAQAIHFSNLGVLYHRWKKYELAEQMYRRALELDANFKSAYTNLLDLRKLKLAEQMHRRAL